MRRTKTYNYDELLKYAGKYSASAILRMHDIPLSRLAEFREAARRNNVSLADPRRVWSKEEDQFILDNHSWMPYVTVAKELGRGALSVLNRAKHLGVSFKKESYTKIIPADDVKLIDALLAEGMSEKEISMKMQCQIGTIRRIKNGVGVYGKILGRKTSELQRLRQENEALKSTLESLGNASPALNKTALDDFKDVYITLVNGHKHYFLRDDWTPDIEVIATSLSQINRWNGHTNVPYSVAQHSLLVSSLVPEEFAFEALLHDAAEAYVGDCPKPLKNLLPQYQTIEEQHYRVIASHYGLPPQTSDIVKQADAQALLMENVCHRDGVDIGISLEGVNTDNWLLAPLPAKVVREMFLERFRQLMEGKAK